MIEFIVSSVFVFALGGVVYHTKRKSDRIFSAFENSVDTTMLAFVERNGLTGIDLQFKTPSDIKKKSKKESIKFIGSSIPKGYDFIDSSFEKGYYFGPHNHEFSSEFIYVLEGKIKIVSFVNGENPQTFILSPNEHYFTIAGKYHTFEALEDSRCITIAVPPISRGVII